MKRKIVWLVVSWLMVLALLVTSCAKKTEETAPVVKEAAPAVKEAAPVVKEAAAVVKEAAATAEAPKYGGILVLSRTSGAITWDPSYMHGGGSSTLLGNEALIQADWAQGQAGSGKYPFTYGWQDLPQPAVVGLLAESWEFPDDQTIIWHIRKGVHWALDPNNAASKLVGGRELTADDIVFNIRWVMWEPRTPQYATAGTARPVDVYATDKYTVVVKSPPGTLGATWEVVGWHVRHVAPEVGKKYGDYRQWENNVGTGPFILTDFVPMSVATWKRNPNYYLTDPVGPGKGNQLPYYDGVKQLVIADTSTRMAALRTGKIDTDSTSYESENAKSLIKTSPQLKYTREVGGIPLIGMRVDGYKPGLPWAGSVPYFPLNPSPADVSALKVRRALNLAYNDQEVCDTLFGGEGQVLSFKIIPSKVYEGIYTPLAQLPESSRELFEYHPDKAKQLLAEAGYPSGFKTHAYVNTTNPAWLDQATMLKEYWRKILNVDLTIRPIDGGTTTNLQVRRTYEEMIFAGRTAYGVTKMYACHTGDWWNVSNVSDPKLDAYYENMAAAFRDIPKRDAIMKELNLYVIPFAWYIYTPAPMVYVFWQPWLKNYHGETTLGMNQTAHQYKFTWIDQEMRKTMAGR